jgi:ribose 5-phosphate isomerase A
MDAKQRAAEAAIPLLASGMVLGLGTGSTADYFLQALARALETGQLSNVVGVPTSRQSEYRALELGIPLTTLGKNPVLDVTVDGADEVDPNLQLIKGLGGALVREKIVAQNSRRFIIIADGSKVVPRLGTRSPLPVEVVPFAFEIQDRFFRSLGAEPTLRKVGGMVFNTDNGNLIYDCKFPSGIADPVAVERAILDRAGVVGSGLFLGMATTVLVGTADGVTRMDRKPATEAGGKQ